MSSALHRLLAVAALAAPLPLACGSVDVTPGPPPDWAACDANSQCVLAAASCCGVCGEPTLADVDGVHRDRLDAHFDAVCPDPVPCPKCATTNNPDLFATCRAGSCVALDLTTEAASACAADSDCRVRTTGCCECGGSTAEADLIAVAITAEQDYASLVCDPSTSCPACQPIYPDDIEAWCDDGHCKLRKLECDPMCAMQGLTCCNGACVATYNDVSNCGGCAVACTDPHPYCDGTACVAPPCDAGTTCADPTFCCGSACCATGQLCCTVPGPGPTGAPACVTPDETGTCPVGCPLCQ